ncbi:MAG: SMP-30/gluconolactonase/LRE family protein [Cyclobacteriaceae bacterium]
MKNYLIILVLIFCACEPKPKDTDAVNETSPEPTQPYIERLAPALDCIIAPDTQIEILADGFEWSEGPLWVESEGFLIFSDVPENRIYKWSETAGISVYLEQSGYTSTEPKGGENGSNGLLINNEGKLVLCQHGDRRMAEMNAPLDSPRAEFTTLADSYDGMRFNSPNDAAFHPDHGLYFTDPPYGLVEYGNDPTKEIPFQGVYRVDNSGEVELLTDSLTRPNGIAFSPDGSKVYVANSDLEKAIWVVYDLTADGGITNGQVFHDATDKVATDYGLPDGLKVRSDGIIFAAGPGGVYIFNAEGEVLGKIRTGQATSNCALNADESYLYITADMYLMRVKLNTSTDGA